MTIDTGEGRMAFPNPMDPKSGWTAQPSGYAIGSAPDMAPSGMVFVPEMNTYVDAEIAAQFGLGAHGHGGAFLWDGPSPLDPRGVPLGLDNGSEIADPENHEISDEDLEALQDQLEEQREVKEPSLSPTLEDIADCFAPEAFRDGLDAMVASGDFGDTLDRVSKATGLDHETSATLIETTVNEVAPIAAEHIGGDRWNSLVYAASQTDDPFARRVVADVVTGKLHPSRLSEAYAMWYRSLPDAVEA